MISLFHKLFPFIRKKETPDSFWEEITKSGTAHSLIYNSTSDFIFLLQLVEDGNLQIKSVNKAMEKILVEAGFVQDIKDLYGKNLDQFFNELGVLEADDIAYRLKQYQTCVDEKKEVSFEIKTPHSKGGGLTFHYTKLSPILNKNGNCLGVTVIVQDTSETVNTLKKLEEKNSLLKESHHRIKNNLQIVSSLLTIQSHQIEDQGVKDKFENSRDRVRAIAMLHEKIYQAQNMAQISASEYVESIVEQLQLSVDDSKRVKIKMEVGNFELNPDLALPCGLIINEAISNSYKHAFSDRDSKGTIQLIFEEKNGLYSLIIKDNGKCSEKEGKSKNDDSLGTQLMQTFAEQLNGEINFCQKEGFEVKLTFQ